MSIMVLVGRSFRCCLCWLRLWRSWTHPSTTCGSCRDTTHSSETTTLCNTAVLTHTHMRARAHLPSELSLNLHITHTKEQHWMHSSKVTKGGENTYFREAAGLMKGKNAKQVPKCSISDKFLKKSRRPWQSQMSFIKPLELTGKTAPHRLTFFTVCKLCFSLILSNILCREMSSKALKTWKTKTYYHAKANTCSLLLLLCSCYYRQYP